MLQHPLEAGQPYTALALNYYLPKFFQYVWNNAKTRVCADGGANRVFLLQKEKNIDLKPPDLVVGDLDSLRQNTREYYEKSGTEFQKIVDQDFNDIEKSLTAIIHRGSRDPVLIFGAWGGRFDHTIGSLHAALAFKDARTYFLDDNNFATWIFPEDKGIICKQRWTTKRCGLLPIMKPVEHIKTAGLKWNCDFGLQMGQFISSSNEIEEGCETIEIQTSDPILWQNQTKKFEDLKKFMIT